MEQGTLQTFQQISDTLLQLTTGDHSDVSSRLLTLAHCVGEALGVQTCLFYQLPDCFSEPTCYWRDPQLPPTALSWEAVDFNTPDSNPHFHTVHCANGVTVCLGILNPPWSAPISSVELQGLLNTAAIAYTHLQLCQQHQYQQSIQDVFTYFSHTLKESADLQSLFPATLHQLGQALLMDRSFIWLLKYKNPLSRSPMPQARIQIAQEWQREQGANAPNLPLSSAFWLAENLTALRAWQQAPEPLEIQSHQTTISATGVGDRWLNWDDFPQLLLVPLLGVPQRQQETPLVLGFMGFQRQQTCPWSENEKALLDWISGQISTALIHHNTLEQVQNLVETRTAQLKGSLEVQARLYEKTRQQVEQLQELIALKDEFLDSVSHELRTPLTSMKVAMRMLRQTNISPERQAKYFTVLEQEWQREYDLIQNLLRLQKLESSATLLPLQELNASVFLTQLAAPFEQRWQPQGLSLALDIPPTLKLYSHPDSLERIINELLINAGKYAEPDTTVRLTVDQVSETVEIEVHNWGQGIAPEAQEQIFEKFVRGKGVTQQAIAGTGLGLALVKALVKHLNGSVRVWSRLATTKQLGETTFTITIPHNLLTTKPIA